MRSAEGILDFLDRYGGKRQVAFILVVKLWVEQDVKPNVYNVYKALMSWMEIFTTEIRGIFTSG